MPNNPSARGGASELPADEIARRVSVITEIRRGALAETSPEQRAAMADHDRLLYDDDGLPV